MYFDPLTGWLVSLISNGLIISNEHVSNSEISQYYREQAKRTNDMMNGDILRLRDKGYSSAEYALNQIKIHVEIAQKSYAISSGYAPLELSREAYEFIIKLCEECQTDYYNRYKNFSRIYRDRIKKGEPKETLSELHKEVETLHSKANSYQSILALAEKGKKEAVQREEEIAKRLAESDSNGTVIVKSIIVIVLIILAFAICLSGEMGKLGMGLLLIGASFGGFFIFNNSNKTK